MEQSLIPIKNIIKEGWEIYKKNFKEFLIPFALFLPLFLYGALAGILNNYLENYIASNWVTLIMLVFYVFALVIYIWSLIILAKLINNIYLKKPFDKDLYQKSAQKIGLYFLIIISAGLITLSGLILLIIPGLFFMVWYGFSDYALILEENIKWTKSFSFSKKLTKGRAWDTFGRIFVPSLLVMVLLIAIIILVIIISMGQGQAFFSALNIANIIFLLIDLLVIPLVIGFKIILYNSLKETRKIKPEMPAAVSTE